MFQPLIFEGCIQLSNVKSCPLASGDSVVVKDHLTTSSTVQSSSLVPNGVGVEVASNPWDWYFLLA